MIDFIKKIYNRSKKPSKKVFLGMSGGVDSSVSAVLLKEQGYDVTGVFIKVWQPDFMTCTWKEDRRDAMRVCAKLGIPFKTIHAEKEYKKEVVDYMITEYKEGRTPNPDVMCNNSVKFGVFYKKAIELGADYIATGHYAKRLEDQNGNVSLGIPLDNTKDQTYFLWNIPRETLVKTLFPLGDITKKEVRKIALQFELSNARKKDSQGLCFIGKVSMKDFLSHYLQLKKGDVVNKEGDVIGYHDGALLYTVGQRHGFYITQKTPHDDRFYVIDKNIDTNTIVVSEKESPDIENATKKTIILSDVNLLVPNDFSTKDIKTRIRYRQPLHEIKNIKIEGRDAYVSFDTLPPMVSLGQSCVFYDNLRCIGGGIISDLI